MDYSYGQELKTARERSGLSLQAVADALHLDAQLIAAIEGEDEKILPAPAYVRGYIRAYAQLVRCEPDTLIARYNIQAKSDPDLVASMHSVAAFKQERDARLMWVGTGIVVSMLMIVIGGWLLIENLFLDTPDVPPLVTPPVLETQPLPDPPDPWETGSMPATADPNVAPPADVTTDPASADPAPQASSAAQPAVVAPEPARQTVTPVAPTPIQEPVPEKPVVTNAQTGDDRLGLALDGVSWIEVLDANGARLVYGLFDAQTRALSVQGQAPFDVTIGDANHVDISVNGQAVSTEPYMRRNNTARFKVESSAGLQ
jgi:cytoskeleton protein RodZ